MLRSSLLFWKAAGGEEAVLWQVPKDPMFTVSSGILTH